MKGEISGIRDEAQGLTRHRAAVTWQPAKGVSISRTQTDKYQGWNSQGWPGEVTWAGLVPRVLRWGGGGTREADGMLPAHAARDPLPCVHDTTSLVPLRAPSSLFSSSVWIPLPPSSSKSWTAMSLPCSETPRGSPMPRHRILLAFKAPQHLVPGHCSSLTPLSSVPHTAPSVPNCPFRACPSCMPLHVASLSLTSAQTQRSLVS